MRIVVMSDTHGDFNAMYRLICRQKKKTDLFLHLGDGEREINDMIALEADLPFLAVRGNCDLRMELPECRTLDAQGVTIFMTHGHERHVKYSLAELQTAARGAGARIALYGHTHCAYYCFDDGLHIMNPGSLSQPRGSKPGFGVIEIRTGQILCNLVPI